MLTIGCFLQNTFKSVTGTFVVPTPKEPSGGSGTHSASAWVGIDGDTCGSAILQTGIDFTVSGTRTSFDGTLRLPALVRCRMTHFLPQPGSSGSPTSRTTSPASPSAPATPSPSASPRRRSQAALRRSSTARPAKRCRTRSPASPRSARRTRSGSSRTSPRAEDSSPSPTGAP